MAKAKAAADEPVDLETLHEAVATIFDQVQTSLANHKKNCVALYKLHQRVATVTKPSQKKNGAVKFVGERAFADTFLDMVNRILGMKKGPASVDRIVKFVGSYIQYLNEKVMQDQEKAESSVEEDTETTTSRFVARILGWLLQGFQAKNKNARFRCLHLVSELISHIGEVDEDTYSLLREGLIERLNDKETIIRAHAAAALSKLVGSEDPDEMEDGEQSVLDILLEVLASDPAAEVRRASLLNVPLTPATLDPILKRTRDVDTTTRKIMYTAVLPKLGHPRHLSLVQREQVIKDGLGDREPGVRVAAGKLLTKWFDVILSEQDAAQPTAGEISWTGDDAGIMRGLIRFLSLFDVIGSGEAIAVDTLISIFVTRPDIPQVFVFPDQYWQPLTPESAVLARVFVEHCIKNNNESLLESASLPVVTAFAFHIQEAYNQLLSVLQKIEAAKLVAAGLDEYEDEDILEEELARKEVVLGELLRMALKLDYGDEIGRRKVFTVVKEMLAHPQLPPGLIDRCVDVLKEIMPSERDLIRVVVEIIVELRENDELEDVDNLLGDLDDQDPDQSSATEPISRGARSIRKPRDRDAMSPEERREADITDIRCLMLCTAVLERVNGSFEDNSTLEGVLADLIVPSVKRKELAMREKALVSLGLCCLIAKNMALRSFQLFMGQIENAPEELKVQVLKVTLDLLIMYDQEFFRKSDAIAQQITNFLIQTLQNEESPAAQAIMCTGICKLVLAGIITDPNVLVTLAMLYISPNTVDNQEVRQCLSYFFPVYSYASAANQCRVQSIFLMAYDQAKVMNDDLEDDQEMIAPYDFGLMLVDWTDPTKAVQITEVERSPNEPNAHVELAIQILSALYDEDRSEIDRKAFCQTLNQLQLPAELNLKSIHKLDLLVSHLSEQCPLNNSATEKLFARFKGRVEQQYRDQLQDIKPSAYAAEDDVLKVYETMAISPSPPQGGDLDEGSEQRRARRIADSDADDASVAPQDEVEPVSNATGTSARTSTRSSRASTAGETASARTATTDQEEEEEAIEQELQGQAEEEEEVERPSTPKPKKGTKRVHTPGTARGDDRKRSRRGTATRRTSKVDETADDDVEADDHDRAQSPTPQKKGRKPAAKAKAPAKSSKAKSTRTSAAGSRTATAARKKRQQPVSDEEKENTAVDAESEASGMESDDI